MIKLGLTGGIGSGKSYVSAILRTMGIPVFDCDSIAKELMITDDFIIVSLKQLLGDEVYLQSGHLNKPLLAKFIFSSKLNADKVNSIVHPRVKTAFIRWTESFSIKGTPIVAMESAILFESGFDDVVDKVIVVDAPVSIRIDRVIKRDNTTPEEVRKRINSQMNDAEKLAKADYILVNDGVMSIDNQLSDIISFLKS